MQNKILLSIIVLLCATLSYSQEFEFGEVSIEELQEAEYPLDTSAHAAVLFKEQKTYFQSIGGALSVVTEIHERIKIYDKEGFDYATESVRLFSNGSTRENMNKIKAQTYNLENGEIVVSKMDKDQIFDNELSENYDQIKFTLPDVKVGSVLEYRYKITSPFITNIDEFRFQYDIPIKKVYAELRTPKGVTFKQMFKGYLPIQSDRISKTDNRIGAVVVDMFELTNVPAMKEENFVDNIENYSSGVIFELVSVEFGTTFRSYSQSWSDVAKMIGNEDDYKKELGKTKFFDEEIDALISETNNPVERCKLIFKYVKDHVKWNGNDGKYLQKGFKDCLEERKGNTADINLLLVSMLRYAGLNANPVVISTKENSIPYFPTLDRLNAVIAYAVINDNEYFMDATEEFGDINLMPVRDYNWNGILIDNENMKWKMINLNVPDQTNTMAMVHATLNEDGELEGTFSSRYTNHSAIYFRDAYKNTDLESHISTLETNMDNIEISNYEAKNTDTYEGYVSHKFDFFYENAAENVSEKLYFNPLAFLKVSSNPFAEETRLYPIDFGYPSKKSYTVSIKLPEGYKIESAPEAIVLKMPNGMGQYKFFIKVTENSLQLNSSSEINVAKIGVEDYPYIKNYFSQMITKQSEKVILTKS